MTRVTAKKTVEELKKGRDALRKQWAEDAAQKAKDSAQKDKANPPAEPTAPPAAAPPVGGNLPAIRPVVLPPTPVGPKGLMVQPTNQKAHETPTPKEEAPKEAPPTTDETPATEDELSEDEIADLFDRAFGTGKLLTPRKYSRIKSPHLIAIDFGEHKVEGKPSKKRGESGFDFGGDSKREKQAPPTAKQQEKEAAKKARQEQKAKQVKEKKAFEKLFAFLRTNSLPYPVTSSLKTKYPWSESLRIFICKGNVLKQLKGIAEGTSLLFVSEALPEGWTEKEDPFADLTHTPVYELKTGKAQFRELMQKQWALIVAYAKEQAKSAVPALTFSQEIPMSYSRFLSPKEANWNFVRGKEGAGEAGKAYFLCQEDDFDAFKKALTQFNPPATFFRGVQWDEGIDPELKDMDPKEFRPRNCLIVEAKDRFEFEESGKADFYKALEADIKVVQEAFKKFNDDSPEGIFPKATKKFLEQAQKIWEKDGIEGLISPAIPKERAQLLATWFMQKKSPPEKDALRLFKTLLEVDLKKAPKILQTYGVPAELAVLWPQFAVSRKVKAGTKVDAKYLAALALQKEGQEFLNNFFEVMTTVDTDPAKTTALVLKAPAADFTAYLRGLGFNDARIQRYQQMRGGGDLELLNALADSIGAETQPGSFTKGRTVWGSMNVHFNRTLTKAIVWGGRNPLQITEEKVHEALPFVKSVDFRWAK